MARMLFVIMVAALAHCAGATTNVVSVGTSAIVVPAVVSLDARAGISTGRVDVVGSFVREGGIVRQLTANGWEVCPPARRLVVVQRLSGATAVVVDGQGDLVRLTPAYSAVVLTGEHATG
ncbi:MAG: hypothetical protein GX636_02895, partial [Actinomycetales bacterium]|nr:hypothetical protein [Actinomycetales bacterium]